MVGTTSGLGGFMSGASIRFSKYKGGTGGADAWRDSLNSTFNKPQRPKTTGEKLPKVNSIHHGQVVSVHDFGVFVQLGDGTIYRDGLMHVTAMTHERVQDPEEFGLKMGVKVWVKVNDVKEDDGKIGLDMRYVDQLSGKDLDIYHTRGRCPQNNWSGGKTPPKPAPVKENWTWNSSGSGRRSPERKRSAEPSDGGSPEEKAKKKRKKKAESSASSGADSSDDGEAKAKASAKLEKMRKKLEKARQKAEKAKKKLEKKADKKDKKKDKKKEKKKKETSESDASGAESASA